jgi:hypothetical protein
MVWLGGEMMQLNLTWGNLVRGLQKLQSIYLHLFHLDFVQEYVGQNFALSEAKLVLSMFL